MELIKENVKVNQVSCKGSAQVLVDEDIIVPDVKPDILKILQLDAVSCITNKSVIKGKAVINGRVDLKILYIPDSEREKIKSIITSFDFTQKNSNKHEIFTKNSHHVGMWRNVRAPPPQKSER